MASLKDTVISGSLRVTDTTYTNDLILGKTYTARYVLAAPTTDGVPSFRVLTNADVGLGNVENTKLSTWTGTNTIKTVGTITTGTWNATVINPNKGGTGVSSYAKGDILYASGAIASTATTALSKLALGTAGYTLQATANGPAWTQIVAVANGGTGNTSFTANRLTWTETATKLVASDHYASSTKIGICYTSEPSYNFAVNGTSYFNGNTTHNGIDYFANDTTYYIDNSAVAYFNDLRSDNVRLVDNWIGFYQNANADGKRYGYIQTNADRMYFCKENGVSSYAFDFNGYIYTNSNIYATGVMYADGNINAHGIWANRSSGERDVGVDCTTSGTIYLFSNGSSKGIYSGTGQCTGSLLHVDGNGATWYGQRFRARTGNVDLVAANGHKVSMQGDRNLVVYDANGAVAWSAGSNSSIKVKDNIKKLNDEDLINFKKLNTISFNYKHEMKMMYNDKRYGLIAEEVLKLYPNLVHIPPEYDDKKFDLNKGMDQHHITLDYEGFIPLLIKMVQKQQDEIDELKQKLKCD